MKRLKWSPSNVVAVLVALYVGAGCPLTGCYGGPVPADAMTVRISSGHWYAKTVRVLCDNGMELATVRGLVLNERRDKRVRLMGCQSVTLRIEAMGGEWWQSDGIMVSDGDTVLLDIGPTLALSAYRVRE